MTAQPYAFADLDARALVIDTVALAALVVALVGVLHLPLVF